MILLLIVLLLLVFSDSDLGRRISAADEPSLLLSFIVSADDTCVDTPVVAEATELFVEKIPSAPSGTFASNVSFPVEKKLATASLSSFSASCS